MTSPQLYTPGGLPVPGLSKEPNVPLDFALLGEYIDPMVVQRYGTTAERDATWDASVAPTGAHCFITGTRKRYIRWESLTGNRWFELYGIALVVNNTADRTNLSNLAAGMRARQADDGSVWVWSGTAWVGDSLPRIAFPFQNSWANYDAVGFHSAVVWSEGRTGFVEGLIKNPASIASAANQIIGRIPAGYRPGPSFGAGPLPTVQHYNGISPLRFDIMPNGDILMNNATGPVIAINQFITLNAFWSLD